MRKLLLTFLVAFFLSLNLAAPLRASEIAPFENEISGPITIAGHTFVPHVLQRELIAKVHYRSYTSLVQRATKKAEKDHWPDERLRRELCELNFLFNYGIFYVYAHGSTPEAVAGQRVFAALIQGNDAIELHVTRWKNAAGPLKKGFGQGLWWNKTLLGTAMTDLDLDQSFQLWIMDRETGKATKYLYEAIGPTLEPQETGRFEALYQLAFKLRHKFRVGFMHLSGHLDERLRKELQNHLGKGEAHFTI